MCAVSCRAKSIQGTIIANQLPVYWLTPVVLVLPSRRRPVFVSERRKSHSIGLAIVSEDSEVQRIRSSLFYPCHFGQLSILFLCTSGSAFIQAASVPDPEPSTSQSHRKLIKMRNRISRWTKTPLIVSTVRSQAIKFGEEVKITIFCSTERMPS